MLGNMQRISLLLTMEKAALQIMLDVDDGREKQRFAIILSFGRYFQCSYKYAEVSIEYKRDKYIYLACYIWSLETTWIYKTYRYDNATSNEPKNNAISSKN